MPASGAKTLPAIGFFTVVEAGEQGLLGGYLVLAANSRPLEFHCTAPVKANRAQEILYGPTLPGYLYGEQIGRALLSAGKSKPVVVCTDREPALTVRDFVSTPVVLVGTDGGNGSDEPAEAERPRLRFDGPHAGAPKPPHLVGFSLGGQSVAVLPAYEEDRERTRDVFESIAAPFDIAEPFERIRDAIDEARRGG